MILMAVCPDITDESVFIRWMGIEIGKINGGIVKDRKRMSDLLAEDNPAATTRKGDPYRFNKPVIEKLAGFLPGDLKNRLKLPIIFFFSADVPDSCCLTDEYALAALRHAGELSSQRTMHDGRCWVARAIACAIMQKYPTAVQLAIGV
jgi:uncharacterized protein (UPF0216 family)